MIGVDGDTPSYCLGACQCRHELSDSTLPSMRHISAASTVVLPHGLEGLWTHHCKAAIVAVSEVVSWLTSSRHPDARPPTFELVHDALVSVESCLMMDPKILDPPVISMTNIPRLFLFLNIMMLQFGLAWLISRPGEVLRTSATALSKAHRCLCEDGGAETEGGRASFATNAHQSVALSQNRPRTRCDSRALEVDAPLPNHQLAGFCFLDRLDRTADWNSPFSNQSGWTGPLTRRDLLLGRR